MTFRVGQEVVCVVASRLGYCEVPLIKGNKYIVEWIGEVPRLTGSCIRVKGIDDYLDQFGRVVPAKFLARRFRPIVKTNIDIFTAMLAPAPKQPVKTDA